MSDAKSNADKQRHLKNALKYALKASALAPKDAEAQIAPAITYGKILSLTDDNGERLALSWKIKSYADKAVALDPKNDTVWHVLGSWHRGVAEVSGTKQFFGGMIHGRIPKSTYPNAVRCFQKAIALNPKRPMHHIELGRVYVAKGEETKGKGVIKHGLGLAQTDKDDPATKRRGRATLAEFE
jgi:tetratricopeptide (TPR) repeat protein